ncbi:hypothetical protein [Burkholderia sp. 22313]|uniref:hypothetical protein n=1 Tax=Burkholderia sp. 22313 TaxID=3453908 RepID=UPI003F83014B
MMELVALGMGVGILPTFPTRGRSGLVQLTEVLHDCQIGLWVLTHRESRHLLRVSTVFEYLSMTLKIRPCDSVCSDAGASRHGPAGPFQWRDAHSVMRAGTPEAR